MRGIPGLRWKSILMGSVVGLAVGLGTYTFIYAKGASYLTNDPAACTNCHVMNEQYNGWVKSSHHAVAVCNDCHTPAGFIGKYATKASNGFWHSFAFTTGWFPEPLQITSRNRDIAEKSCQKCHEDITENIAGAHTGKQDAEQSCLRCHGSVGHMR
jgi:cytochrome c nitrite reductase small subunit